MRLRESVRALVLDEADSVLLVRFEWPGTGAFWANPGGGIEPGESREAALARELLEETGLVLAGLGPEVWTKTAVFSMGDWDGQVDHIHLLRVDRFDPAPRLTPAQLAAEHVHEVRWWSPAELAAGGVTFAPRALPELLRALLRDGVPAEPLLLEGF